MLISHKHKFVFIHNPKVGGTTFNDALTSLCEENRYRGRSLVGDEVADLCHYRVDQWPAELHQAYHDGYYFFGVVRDPYERFLSAMSEHTHQHADLLATASSTYDYYVTNLGHNAIRHDWRYTHFCPQYTYFTEPSSGSLLSRVEILRLEDISSWWPNVFRKIGVEAPSLFNGRPSFFRPSHLDPALAPLINDLYAVDFSTFGFHMLTPSAGAQAKYLDDLPDYRKVERACLGYATDSYPSRFVQAALSYPHPAPQPHSRDLQ